MIIYTMFHFFLPLYIGPGLGLGALALIAIIFLIVVGSIVLILWIPLKNAFKKMVKFFRK